MVFINLKLDKQEDFV